MFRKFAYVCSLAVLAELAVSRSVCGDSPTTTPQAPNVEMRLTIDAPKSEHAVVQLKITLTNNTANVIQLQIDEPALEYSISVFDTAGKQIDMTELGQQLSHQPADFGLQLGKLEANGGTRVDALDLRRFFQLSSIGRYRVQVKRTLADGQNNRFNLNSDITFEVGAFSKADK